VALQLAEQAQGVDENHPHAWQTQKATIRINPALCESPLSHRKIIMKNKKNENNITEYFDQILKRHAEKYITPVTCFDRPNLGYLVTDPNAE